MRVAVVGAGVSGLVAAHLLDPVHDVTVYEADDRLGGHTNTVRVDTAYETHWIDTGFIVCNDRTYPNFNRLLRRLGVATQATHMGFSVKGEVEDFEYAGTPRGLLCQPRNGLRPTFWRMVADLLRFNRELAALLRDGEGAGADTSLGEFLDRGRYSPAFTERLIVPQVCAVWSADPGTLWRFPVRFLAQFLANHGMLGFRDRPRWSTIVGGSHRYVQAIADPLHGRIRLGCPVRSVARDDGGVTITAAGVGAERYDRVVLATHSDQALALLADPSDAEREVLGAIPYQHNEAVLHTDASLLPRRRAARQAWNYHLLAQPKPLPTVTYYANHLQRLRADRDFCVTLNLTEAIDPSTIIRTIPYSHPVYTPAGMRAQARHAALNGVRRTHYCGAYWGWGFHEDGVVSALRALAPLGAAL